MKITNSANNIITSPEASTSEQPKPTLILLNFVEEKILNEVWINEELHTRQSLNLQYINGVLKLTQNTYSQHSAVPTSTEIFTTEIQPTHE